MEKVNIKTGTVGRSYLIYVPNNIKISVSYTDNYNQQQNTYLDSGFYEAVLNRIIYAVGKPKYFYFYHNLYGDIEIDNPLIFGVDLEEVDIIRNKMKIVLNPDCGV